MGPSRKSKRSFEWDIYVFGGLMVVVVALFLVFISEVLAPVIRFIKRL